MTQHFKYFAFISYSSHDIAWGKKLQKKLEGYRMPSTLCSEHGWQRNPIKPVFFAPTDIQPGDLDEELKERLKASRNLIVICSPHSAKSDWVGKEIAFFHSLRRSSNIHFFIVDGIPHSGNSDTECFNPIVKTLDIPEILGANIHEKVFKSPWLNRERAYIQLITKLLGVEFDSIWQRHRRLLRQKITTWCLGVFAVFATLVGVRITSRPINVEVSLNETTPHNKHLPPLKDAIVTLSLDNETKTDTLPSLDSKALFANIPHSFIGKRACVKIECKDWLPVDTTFILTKNPIINIARNPECYGNVKFLLWNLKKEKGMGNVKVEIAGQTSTSDANGNVKMQIPLKNQREKYQVLCNLDLDNNILVMPTTQSTALIVKE